MIATTGAVRSVAEGPLVVQRWAPKRFDIPCEGFDFTGQPLTMQVRAYPDAPGAALIDLADTASPAEGLSVSVETVAGLTTSTIQIRINETTIENLLPFDTNGTEPGQNVVLAYAIHVGSGSAKRRFIQGNFIIEPGANQA